ncbi:cytochrome P450 52A12 [Lentithecium fluviatile CBS 122367]|uniref:Cytochrome P450 52A12 n=1 Tax=Lentithecium fluviatile CBS 122367 TaxID=1168545 RepID=A0A6G1JA43_9PLEO|nr:cytochrome P450 52A12 [Lentithecium fluviatile CBS 122367]
MALTNSPILYVLAGAFISYMLYTRITLYRRRQRMIAEHGCKPCPHIYNTDNIIGLNVFKENLYNFKNRRVLEGNRARFLKQNTHTFRSRMMHMPIIATAEPENIKTILSLRFKDYSFGNRQQSFTPLLGEGIFNSDGEKWANSRHLIRPNFVREQVANLEAFERHFKLLLRHIPTDGSTLDIQPLFFKLTIDSATEFLFNHSTNSLRMTDEDDENNEDAIFGRAFNYAQGDIVERLRWAFLDPFRPKKKAIEAIRICHAYVDKFVDEAIQWRRERETSGKLAEDDGRYVFIHELVKQTDDKERVRSELINVLLAGRDTTASLLSNAMFEISKRPDIWAKLRQEVEVLGGREPTYEELRNFKYIKWCLNESLRLNPVVPQNSRYAIRDTILPLGGGPDCKSPLFVPQGWTVGYSPYTLHRRKDFYGPDADEFRPERWETLRLGWEYLPFNGGPRICLGQQYALTEAGYVVCRLAQEFKKVECRDETGVWVEALTVTVCSGNGVKVGLFRE